MNTTSRLLAVLVSGVAAAQGHTLFPITSLASSNSPDPRFGPGTISTTVNSGAVSQVAQIELRPIGSTGVYNVTCTVLLAGLPGRPQLLTGTLDLGVSPAVWTPNADVDALNLPNPPATQPFISFQLTMSPDQLVIVWDNYPGTSSGSNWPNALVAPTKAHTFVCARPNTSVPFRSAAAWPVVGFTNYWSDSHVGPALPNGRYEYFFSDMANGGLGNIVRAELDSATGQVFAPPGATAPVTVRSKQTAVVYAHSPFDLRDSTGKSRALSFGQTMNTTPTSPSNMFWAPNVTDTGTPYLLADGFTYPLPPNGPLGWFSNGSANGGTLVYGLYSNALGVQIHPQIVEHLLIADTDLTLTPPEPIAAWAPIRPLGTAPVAPSFASIVAISSGLVPPFNLPPLLGQCVLQPTSLLLLGLTLHDPYTGYAQWIVGAPNPPLNVSLPMQSVTLEFSTGNLYFGNLAQLRL